MAEQRATFIFDLKGESRIGDVCGMGKKCGEFTKPAEDRLGKVDESSREQTEEYTKSVDENYEQS